MNSIIVFLSTPRCGTQWLAKNLSDIYSDRVVTLHEPIKYEYYPKLNLGRYDAPAKPESNPALDEHLDFIEEVTENKIYIEVGWQSIAGIPVLHRKFGNHLKLIHLYRNPINVAASLVTHSWYTGKIEDRFEKAELTPFDEGSILTGYRNKWDSLSLFEKSLYYWTEINLRSIEIKNRYSDLRFNSLKFENLFKKDKETSRISLIEILSFSDLNYCEKMLEAIKIPHDEYRKRTHIEVEWKKITNHPQTIALANKLGYHFDDEINLRRYKRLSLYQRALRKVKKKFKEAGF